MVPKSITELVPDELSTRRLMRECPDCEGTQGFHTYECDKESGRLAAMKVSEGFKSDFDTIDRQGRSLGRLSMIRDTLAEINRRTANMAPNSFSLKSLVSLGEWLGEQAERERP